ncbi:MAG: diaminopimelate decarboxylase [Chlorobi bacterium]|nr:diaminopimelate decarboxylase [Chlorobiota bacterium]
MNIKQNINNISTPFYYYDIDLLKTTLDVVFKESSKYGYNVHYAIKANANTKILKIIRDYNIGADCVSGNEITKAIEVGFNSDKIVFAGVGKSDKEIITAIDNNIFCFNCESVPELEIINKLAAQKEKIVHIALRLNPNIDPHTHKYITTGLEENKFGINLWDIDTVLNRISELKNLKLCGIHFHIGSQITDLNVYKNLSLKVNEINSLFQKKGIVPEHINLGGGLGIDYDNPGKNNIPDFKAYFEIYNSNLKLLPNQKVHFELGRSIVAQCGNLITKVLYVKEGLNKKFVIVDAGMTELIRSALYNAHHSIENLSSNYDKEKYDVVGPICESSDFFAKDIMLPKCTRNDIIAIRSAGAYGQVMSSQYNLRDLAKAYYSDELD